MTGSHVVFVYGTLTDPDRVAAVLGADAADRRGAATLRGLHRVEGEYPTLAPGGRVDGQLLAVDDAGLDAFDDYEGVTRGLYARVSVPCRHPAVDADTVWTYVGDPERLGAAAEWPDGDSFDDRVRTALDAADVSVGPRDERSAE